MVESAPSAACCPFMKFKDCRLLMCRAILFLSLLSVGLVADLVTKSIFLSKYPPNAMAPVWWIDGVLGVQTSTNGGALFGIGDGGSHWFALFSVVALIFVVYWLFIAGNATSIWLTFALGLVSGGILGNFYDRVGMGYHPSWNAPHLKGHVRDWIHFRLEGVPFFDPWPNFNIADSLLVTGAFLLILFTLFGVGIESKENTTHQSNEANLLTNQSRNE